MAPRTKAQFEAIRTASREKILLAALELFATKSYPGTSINDIAKKAEASKGLIYHYFESKEEIMRAVMEMVMDMLGEFMGQVKSKSGDDPKKALETLIDTYFHSLETRLDMLRWVLPLALNMEDYQFVNDIVQNQFDQSVAYAAQIFERLGYDQPQEEARLLIAIMDGIGLDTAALSGYDTARMHRYLLKKYDLL